MLWSLTGTVAALLLLLIVALAIYGFAHRDTVYSGVRVNGVELGGLTERQATEALRQRGDAYAASPMTVRGGDQDFSTTPAELGFDLDEAGTARAAFDQGRTGNWWHRSQQWVLGLRGGLDVPPRIQINETSLNAWLSRTAEGVDRKPVDASVDLSSGSPVLHQDVVGIQVDRHGSASRLQSALLNMDDSPQTLVTTTLNPSVTASSLQGAMPLAESATDAPFTINGPGGNWSLSREQLASIVTVDPTTASIKVNDGSVREFVQGIATKVNTDAVNANITLGADGQLQIVPGQNAVSVDVDATTAQATAAIASGADAVDLVTTSRPPAITNEMARAGLDEVNGYLDSGVKLTWNGGSMTLGRSDLLQALTISDTGGDPFLFTFDATVLAGVVEPAYARVDNPAQDARFRVVDGTVKQVQKAKDGEVVDRDGTTSALIDAIYHHTPEVRMLVKDDKPDVTDAMGKDIQVPDLLAQGTTYYATSSAARRTNVERAAQLEDGWLVPPDGIFSYDELLGSIDTANGFDTGFGIITDADRGGVTTAPVIGGGICQVSTTILQAGWFGGLPVIERYQHPYWLESYGVAPSGRLGLDATVNIADTWQLDLKMKNTTGNWIAFVITADGNALTVSLMGTNPGWTVTVADPVVTNRVAAPTGMEYEDSPEMPKGEELQVESATDGFSVRLDRTVRDRKGNVILQDNLTSDYQPASNLTLRGTGS